MNETNEQAKKKMNKEENNKKILFNFNNRYEMNKMAFSTI